MKEEDKDYKKKYNETLEKLKTMHDAWSKLDVSYPAKDTVKDLEYYFPELKESKDEKIRKTIIREFEQCSEWYCDNGVTKDQIIAWLEKQVVWKPTKEQLKLLKEAIDTYYFDLDGLCPLYVLYRELKNIGIRE